jgi:excisionase family DNA binding protein
MTGALTIADFCREYGIGRTATYAEIKAGRLSAVKCGSRTLIARAEAERWLASLPAADSASSRERFIVMGRKSKRRAVA